MKRLSVYKMLEDYAPWMQADETLRKAFCKRMRMLHYSKRELQAAFFAYAIGYDLGVRADR